MGADSPPKFRGGMSEAPCFTAFFERCSLNSGGASSPPKFRGSGLTGYRKRAEYGSGEHGSTGSNADLSEFFGRHRVLERELSELLSAYYLCANAYSPSFSQNLPSLA